MKMLVCYLTQQDNFNEAFETASESIKKSKSKSLRERNVSFCAFIFNSLIIFGVGVWGAQSGAKTAVTNIMKNPLQIMESTRNCLHKMVI